MSVNEFEGESSENSKRIEFDQLQEKVSRLRGENQRAAVRYRSLTESNQQLGSVLGDLNRRIAENKKKQLRYQRRLSKTEQKAKELIAETEDIKTRLLNDPEYSKLLKEIKKLRRLKKQVEQLLQKIRDDLATQKNSKNEDDLLNIQKRRNFFKARNRELKLRLEVIDLMMKNPNPNENKKKEVEDLLLQIENLNSSASESGENSDEDLKADEPEDSSSLNQQTSQSDQNSPSRRPKTRRELGKLSKPGKSPLSLDNEEAGDDYYSEEESPEKGKEGEPTIPNNQNASDQEKTSEGQSNKRKEEEDEKSKKSQKDKSQETEKSNDGVETTQKVEEEDKSQSQKDGNSNEEETSLAEKDGIEKAQKEKKDKRKSEGEDATSQTGKEADLLVDDEKSKNNKNQEEESGDEVETSQTTGKDKKKKGEKKDKKKGEKKGKKKKGEKDENEEVEDQEEEESGDEVKSSQTAGKDKEKKGEKKDKKKKGENDENEEVEGQEEEESGDEVKSSQTTGKDKKNKGKKKEKKGEKKNKKKKGEKDEEDQEEGESGDEENPSLNEKRIPHSGKTRKHHNPDSRRKPRRHHPKHISVEEQDENNMPTEEQTQTDIKKKKKRKHTQSKDIPPPVVEQEPILSREDLQSTPELDAITHPAEELHDLEEHQEKLAGEIAQKEKIKRNLESDLNAIHNRNSGQKRVLKIVRWKGDFVSAVPEKSDQSPTYSLDSRIISVQTDLTGDSIAFYQNYLQNQNASVAPIVKIKDRYKEAQKQIKHYQIKIEKAQQDQAALQEKISFIYQEMRNLKNEIENQDEFLAAEEERSKQYSASLKAIDDQISTHQEDHDDHQKEYDELKAIYDEMLKFTFNLDAELRDLSNREKPEVRQLLKDVSQLNTRLEDSSIKYEQVAKRVESKRNTPQEIMESKEYQDLIDLKVEKANLERRLRKWTLITKSSKKSTTENETFSVRNFKRRKDLVDRIRSKERSILMEEDVIYELEKYSALLEQISSEHSPIVPA